MQAVILAAGRGKRMGVLTDTTPKPMLQVAGKTLLEHKFDILPAEIDEVVLVVGYLENKIRDYFGDSYLGKSIKYVHQDTLAGTGHSLWQAREHLKDKFLVMMGDDLYSKWDIQNALTHDWAILVNKVPELHRGGKVILDENNKVKDVVEGDAHGGNPGIVYTGLAVLHPDIFKHELVKLEGREEFGLPQTIVRALKENPAIALNVVEATSWITITDAEDLKRAEKILHLDAVEVPRVA